LLKQEQSDFMTLIRILAKTRQWKDPAFKHLKSKYSWFAHF
jgi:predicted double-glycine peptidase